MNPPNHLPPYPEDPSIRLIRYFGQGMTEKDMNGADAFLVTIEGCDHWALRDCKYPQGVKTSYYARVWYTTPLRKGTILR